MLIPVKKLWSQLVIKDNFFSDHSGPSGVKGMNSFYGQINKEESLFLFWGVYHREYILKYLVLLSLWVIRELVSLLMRNSFYQNREVVSMLFLFIFCNYTAVVLIWDYSYISTNIGFSLILILFVDKGI